MGMGGVAFITLLERKLLGLSQMRLGPNKTTIWGVLQPVIDGVKLLIKLLLVIKNRQRNLFILRPVMLIFMFGFVWIFILPWIRGIFYIKYTSLVFFCLLGVGTYAVIITGWRSIRNYSKLGRLRGILQRLSFEVNLILVFFIPLILMHSLNVKPNQNLWEILVSWILIWILLSLIESNRAPFDLIEGESELIRGFNIEMGSLMFVYLFLREYGILISLSLLLCFVLTSIIYISIIIIMFILFIRRCFPRIRWDIIIGLIWQLVMPTGIVVFIIRFFLSLEKPDYRFDFESNNYINNIFFKKLYRCNLGISYTKKHFLYVRIW